MVRKDLDFQYISRTQDLNFFMPQRIKAAWLARIIQRQRSARPPALMRHSIFSSGFCVLYGRAAWALGALIAAMQSSLPYSVALVPPG
jgi:hypothetical protein